MLLCVHFCVGKQKTHLLAGLAQIKKNLKLETSSLLHRDTPYRYSRTSVSRTLMTRLPRLLRIRSRVRNKTRGPWATKLAKAAVHNCHHLLFGLALLFRHFRFELTLFNQRTYGPVANLSPLNPQHSGIINSEANCRI